MYVRSYCSGFLQDDITVANQLHWEFSEIAPGVIRFKSTVDIRRSDMKAPKADRIMRAQANRSNAYKRITHTRIMHSRDILEPSGTRGVQSPNIYRHISEIVNIGSCMPPY